MNERELYYGDNLDVLRKYFRDETIDLCYIDPPFNSKRNYNQIYNNIGKEDQAQAQAFTDTWTWDTRAIEGLDEIFSNSRGLMTTQAIELMQGLSKVLGKGSLFAYLVSMTLRIAEIWRALKPTGSFYLHCDPTASHYLKLVLDAIFCGHGGDFINEISWRRINAKSDFKQGAQNWGRVRDIILFYRKNAKLKGTFNQQFIEYSDKYVSKFYKYQDEQGRWYQFGDLTAPGAGSRGHPQYEFMGVTRYWRYSQDKMNELLQEGRIVQPKPGSVPRYKRYLDEMQGVAICDDWDDIPSIQAQAKERLGYPTQKPEALLERILKASSHEGDVVLDAYCGCGSTVAVAERLKRRWRGIDITYQSISVILKRLEESFGQDVLQAIQLSGIPQDIDSAKALAMKQDDRVRKEFEKWAVLTYTNNRAVIHEKKGGDKGIDGVAFVQETADEYKQVILSVKSGKLQLSMIRDLRGTIEREQAAMGILLTLEPPSRGMIQEAKSAGVYKNPFMAGQTFDKLQIVTIQDMLEGKRLALPLTHEVLKKAKSQIRAEQSGLFEA